MLAHELEILADFLIKRNAEKPSIRTPTPVAVVPITAGRMAGRLRDTGGAGGGSWVAEAGNIVSDGLGTCVKAEVKTFGS